MQTVRAPMHVISQQDRDQHQQTTTRKNKTKHVKLNFYIIILSVSPFLGEMVSFSGIAVGHIYQIFLEELLK